MPLLGQNDGNGPDGDVENLTFEILMESVLKMSKLMNVSVFLLVEQSCGRKRRYGGSPQLCEAFKKGKLMAKNGGNDDDVHVKVVGGDEKEEERESTAAVIGGELTASPVSLPSPIAAAAEENYEIVETLELIGGDTDYEDSDYVGEPDDFADDGDDDSDSESSDRRKKKKSFVASRKKLQDRQRRESSSQKRPTLLSKVLKNQSQQHRMSHPVDDQRDAFAQQVRDFAEGRGDYEETDAAWVSKVRVENVCNLIEPVEVVEDAGARNDSSEDDDWKPVNYGRGKLFKREKKKYHRKELKKKERRAMRDFGGDQEDGSLLKNSSKGRANEGGDCPHCQKYFQKLKQHMQEVHESDRKHSCEYCASRFKRDEHLKKHLRGVHKVSAL